MRKYFLFLFISLLFVDEIKAQTKGTKIGYIDMEYILQNVPNYKEAQNQLELKIQKWKQEIEVKKLEINKLKEALKSEKALLTKNLIDERETEIKFLEEESLDYQQKRFGPNGDLMIQKLTLTKPIQDQVFTAIQDIAEAKKYDFIFDKNSDLTILFAAKRFDISDQVLRVLNRVEKREQLTKKQLKEEEAKEEKEDALDQNSAIASRQKALDDRKIARDQAIEERKLLQEQRKLEVENKRKQILADRAAKKSSLIPETSKSSDPATSDKEAMKEATSKARQKQAEERLKVLEDRKKEAEQKRKKILEDREAKKNTAISGSLKPNETVPNLETETTKSATDVAKQKQSIERSKILEERLKGLEERKKEAELKRKKILEDREAKKTGTISEINKKVEPIKTEVSTEKNKDTLNSQTLKSKEKQVEEKAKTLEDRKKALEDKRKKILEERAASKKLKEETLKTTKEKSNNN